jgi:hypothetical protein
MFRSTNEVSKYGITIREIIQSLTISLFCKLRTDLAGESTGAAVRPWLCVAVGSCSNPWTADRTAAGSGSGWSSALAPAGHCEL